MGKKKYLLRVAGFFLASVLVTLPSTLAAQARSESAPVKLRAGGFGLESVTNWPTIIAQQKGFFASEGLTVEYNRSYEQMPALIGGSFDVIDTGADTTVLAADKGANIVIVYETSHRPPQFMVLGPGINSVKEMEGKLFGVWRIPSTDQVILNKFFAKQGMDPAKVTLFRVGGSRDRFVALQTGRISATILAIEFGIPAIKEGMKIVATPRDWGVFPWSPLVFGRQWAEAHQDIVVKYVRSIYRAGKWLIDQTNSEEAVRLVSQAAKIDPEVVKWTLQLVIKDQIYNVDKPSVSVMQLAADWLLSEKLIAKPFNVGKIVDTRYYERAMK